MTSQRILTKFISQVWNSTLETWLPANIFIHFDEDAERSEYFCWFLFLVNENILESPEKWKKKTLVWLFDSSAVCVCDVRGSVHCALVSSERSQALEKYLKKNTKTESMLLSRVVFKLNRVDTKLAGEKERTN